MSVGPRDNFLRDEILFSYIEILEPRNLFNDTQNC